MRCRRAANTRTIRTSQSPGSVKTGFAATDIADLRTIEVRTIAAQGKAGSWALQPRSQVARMQFVRRKRSTPQFLAREFCTLREAFELRPHHLRMYALHRLAL